MFFLFLLENSMTKKENKLFTLIIKVLCKLYLLAPILHQQLILRVSLNAAL